MTTNTPTPEAALDGAELIKPGPATAMSGAVMTFTPAMIAELADSYDPAVHEAPHVKGHPSSDGPAMGWVEHVSVNAAGRLVLDKSRQVDAAFADDVRAGRWKKRSLSIYLPGAPNNPTPGRLQIKHVGWLGAMPPAIKGLRDNIHNSAAAFAEPEAGVLTFGDWADETNAGLWRRLRDWLIGSAGLDAADKVIPSYEVDALQREALRPEPDDTAPTTPRMTAYAEGDPALTTATASPNTPAALDARAADLNAREARIAQQEADQAALLASARNAGLAAFADSMVAEGRLLPGERGPVLAAMQAVPDTCTMIEFADGDPAKPVTHPAVDAFKAFIKSLPPRVDFSERGGADKAAPTVDLSDAQAIAKAATEFVHTEAAAGRTVGVPQAVAHVMATNAAA